MQDRQYDGVLLEDKWGKTYLCSSCLLARADFGEAHVTEVKDSVFGRYFLHDLEPCWNLRQIWGDMYQHAKPWVFDLSTFTDFQLRDALLEIFASDEMRIWQLTEGWGAPPEGNGIGEGGLAPASGSGTSLAPITKTAKPGGGALVDAPVAAKAASHEVSSQEPNTQSTAAGDPSVEEVTLAKSPGSTPAHIAARERVSRHFLESNGFSESQIANAIGDEEAGIDGGVDLTKPVEVVSFPPPVK